MIRLLLLAAVTATCMTALAACASVAEPLQTRPVGTDHPCKADDVDGYMGETATAALGLAIQKHTGAQVFQWVPPDTAVTMDFRPDRVRVTYDRKMRVTAIRCG
ncbi:hypothetical protein GRI58_03505 [Porphyrobacter algicida]|uniref:Peptidase inhibitor I78 n=1 Tax=Qipengyuania algicida TaxID=1836209 RepID=A0A845AEQ4_9SPHN|nr:I78 family peptidase inhibitor [Qipengyuania algicida]MXP27889.1 hypothetical protein [Qipengyuania algicida]